MEHSITLLAQNFVGLGNRHRRESYRGRFGKRKNGILSLLGFDALATSPSNNYRMPAR
jgi:hypothetical protein